MKLYTLPFAMLALLALSAQGCGVEVSEDEAAATSGESLVSSNLDRKGALRVGAATTLAYRTSTKYVAYEFRGEKSDLIDLRVHNTGGGSGMMYVLDANYATLASHNTAVSKDLRYLGFDPHVQVALPASGTYVVAFRFVETGDVTIASRLMPAGPPASNNPFDPASCPGSSLTFREAAKLAANQGANPRRAPYTLMVRTRGCSETVCDPWGEPEEAMPIPRYGQFPPVAGQPVDGFVTFGMNPGENDRGSRGDTLHIYASSRLGGGGAHFASIEPRALPQTTPLTFRSTSPYDSLLRYRYSNIYGSSNDSYMEPPFDEITATNTCVRMVSRVHYNARQQYALLARF